MLVPGWRHFVRKQRTGGTVDPDYCYSVWLRHLVKLHEAHLPTRMDSVAELGPGDSLGTSLAALLTGASVCYALDIVAFSTRERNQRILDELVGRFQQRSPIPHQGNLERVRPLLADYAFPESVLGDTLAATISTSRVAQIRAALQGGQRVDPMISYRVPWTNHAALDAGSVDHIYSQAVLEHVDDLADIYYSCFRWLRPGGTMSHTIDFRCHGTATTWNGHWTYSDKVWSLIRGGRSYLINRQPYTTHVKLAKETGFDVITLERERAASSLKRSELSESFRHLDEDELTTRGLFMIACKPASI